jgi:hypothetical protein
LLVVVWRLCGFLLLNVHRALCCVSHFIVYGSAELPSPHSLTHSLTHYPYSSIITHSQSPTKLYFVLDYCPGGELFFWLSREKRLPEHMSRFYTSEITLAIEYLHSKQVISCGGTIDRHIYIRSIFLLHEATARVACHFKQQFFNHAPPRRRLW